MEEHEKNGVVCDKDGSQAGVRYVWPPLPRSDILGYEESNSGGKKRHQMELHDSVRKP